jgi:hypothetical protein
VKELTDAHGLAARQVPITFQPGEADAVLAGQCPMNVSWWKLDRELQRIAQQLRGIPEFFFEPGKQRRHDATRAQTLRQTEGKAQASAKVALLLIYQPSGLRASTLWSCEHLRSKGYAPLVVSNAPLASEDAARLAEVSWRMVERPNFGYDFGGYRDGIWLLQEWGVAVDQLIILNDSIWFPLNGDETLIDQMESAPADVVGALQLDPLRQTIGVPAKKRPFSGSFFLMIKGSAWAHPSFKTFWESYRITSNKYKTIRRGERGFSHAMIDAGLTCQSIYTRGELDQYIASLPNTDLRNLLNELVSIDESALKALDLARTSYADTPAWRAVALDAAMLATEKQNVLATAPIISLTEFRVPYLKKARDKNNLAALRKVRQHMDEGRLPMPHPSILKEIDLVLAH